MKILIKSIRIALLRRARRNNDQDYCKIMNSCDQVINRKYFHLQQQGKQYYYISDFILFPTLSNYNSVYPPNIYESFEKRGFINFKVNIDFKYCLYPSTVNGLVSVDYYIDVKLFFDNSFIFDEKFLVPIYFSVNFEENNEENKIISQEISNSII